MVDKIHHSAYVDHLFQFRSVGRRSLISKINYFLLKKYKIIESTNQVIPKNAIETCNI
ncbi:MAG: hypothetical protein ACFFB0_16540 [Promethearchaeota archaeon]